MAAANPNPNAIIIAAQPEAPLEGDPPVVQPICNVCYRPYDIGMKNDHDEEYGHLVDYQRYKGSKPKVAREKNLMKHSPASTPGPSTVAKNEVKKQAKKQKDNRKQMEAAARKAARN